MAIDYGLRRVGIAVTDPSKIISSPLETIDSERILDFLSEYQKNEALEKIVVGWPTDLRGKNTDATAMVERFINTLKSKFPSISIEKWDERFTSKMAKKVIIAGGVKKQKRRDKKLIDKISASLILQSYLGH